MIASFFQSLSRHRVEYLLISGQATVLYGAATFSEDIDLWVNPTERNSPRLLDALREMGGRYYKLTPPLIGKHLARGHGFHFLLPAPGETPVFLDVMGVPPRVGEFSTAWASAAWMDTDWGRLPTIDLKSLVELKKTQRLEDYPIISKLVIAWFSRPECKRPHDHYAWAVQNLFTIPELRLFFEEQPGALQNLSLNNEVFPGLLEFGRQIQAGGDVTEETANLATIGLQQRIAQRQAADRRYWRDIIAELRQLRNRGELILEGSPV